VKKLLLLAGAAALMAACSDTSTAPGAPRTAAPVNRANADLTCASGYIIAYDENGNPYCAPDPNSKAATTLPTARP